MVLTALFLSILGQDVAQVPPQNIAAFGAPLTVVEPSRLALTPRLDGLISPEEWDPWADASGSKAYLQWEPNRLHIAGVVPKGHDLVVSIDLDNNGWLRGKDNLEFRASLVGTQATLTTRVLDATLRDGPQWFPVATFQPRSKVEAREGEESTVYEMTIEDTALDVFRPRRESEYAVRYDVVPSGGETVAFLPRALNVVKLVTQRSAGMPNGLSTGVQDDFQTVVPGEDMRMRATFRGSNALGLQTLSFRSEGDAADKTMTQSMPFMKFDNKGRAFKDYDTRVAANASTGYRIMRATVVAGDGIEGIVQASYRIAPVIDFNLRSGPIKAKEESQVVRIHYSIRSNSVNRVSGLVEAELPATWQNLTAVDRGFTISRKGFASERILDVQLPPAAKGIFPIKLKTVVKDVPIEDTIYVTIR